MQRIHLYLLLVLTFMTFGFAVTARAQHWDWNDEGSARQLRAFEVFMNNHPWIAKRLKEKPERINDRDFVNDHKELRQWVEDFPAAARAFQSDPRGFMERERRFEAYGGDFDARDGRRGDLARFDWFLDNHPDIRRDLMKRPELINKREYMEHHPRLQEFLDNHPGLRDELRDHPREFMERESHFNRDN